MLKISSLLDSQRLCCSSSLKCSVLLTNSNQVLKSHGDRLIMLVLVTPQGLEGKQRKIGR